MNQEPEQEEEESPSHHPLNKSPDHPQPQGAGSGAEKEKGRQTTVGPTSRKVRGRQPKGGHLYTDPDPFQGRVCSFTKRATSSAE